MPHTLSIVNFKVYSSLLFFSLCHLKTNNGGETGGEVGLSQKVPISFGPLLVNVCLTIQSTECTVDRELLYDAAQADTGRRFVFIHELAALLCKK